jgi:hypothetical protein
MEEGDQVRNSGDLFRCIEPSFKGGEFFPAILQEELSEVKNLSLGRREGLCLVRGGEKSGGSPRGASRRVDCRFSFHAPKGSQGFPIGGGDGVDSGGVPVGIKEGEAEEGVAETVEAVVEIGFALLGGGVCFGLFTERRPKNGGREILFPRAWAIEVPGELSAQELVDGAVAVDPVDDPVAPFPKGRRRGFGWKGGVGVENGLEPEIGKGVAELYAGEVFIDKKLIISLWVCAGQEHLGFFESGWEAREIDGDSAEQGEGVCCWRGLRMGFGKVLQSELIDAIAHPRRVAKFLGRSEPFGKGLKSPVVLMLRSFVPPTHEEGGFPEGEEVLVRAVSG